MPIWCEATAARIRRLADRTTPHLRVKYVSTEELTNDFINAISQNKGAEFRRRYLSEPGREGVIAESDDTVVVEGNHYFPADSVERELMIATALRDTYSVRPRRSRPSAPP